MMKNHTLLSGFAAASLLLAGVRPVSAFYAKVQTADNKPIAGVAVTFARFDTTAYSNDSGIVSFSHGTAVIPGVKSGPSASLRLTKRTMVVDAAAPGEAEVRLYSLSGRCVFSYKKTLSAGRSFAVLPVTATGMYVLQARIGDRSFVQKINMSDGCARPTAPAGDRTGLQKVMKKTATADTAVFSKTGFTGVRRPFATYFDDLGVIVLESSAMQGDVKAVAAGCNHTMIIKQDNTLWATGYIGTKNTATPVHVTGDVAAVSSNGSFAMFLKSDASLWAMGDNRFGQLGTADFTAKSAPEQVLSKAASVSAGGCHTLAVRSDNTLWAMGNNDFGQLGDGTDSVRNFPRQVLSDVASVSAGAFHSMILKKDNTLWACGQNYYGQLGDGTVFEKHAPVQVMSDVAGVAAGDRHTMVLKKDNTLWAMGDNEFGQLGDGTFSFKSSPEKIMGDVAAVSAGYGYTMIIKTDGTLWAAGKNRAYQLGTGDTAARCAPAQILGDVAAVSACSSFTVILRKNGTLWATGTNCRFGELYSLLCAPSMVMPACFRGLTVSGGTGSGSYRAGTNVTVSAFDSIAPRRVFHHWGGPDSNVLIWSRKTKKVSFTMPDRDIVVAAFYWDRPSLTVSGGNGSGWYDSAAAVAIVADDSSGANRFFIRWSGPDSALVKDKTNPTTTFSMPGRRAAVTAVFGSPHTLTINGGRGSGSYVAGRSVSISVDDSTAQKRGFDHWGGPDSALAGSRFGSSAITIIMPDRAASLTAVNGNLFALTVIGGKTSGNFLHNTKVSINADDSAAAHRCFDHWGGLDSALVENDTLRSTYFTMPGRPAAIYAVFRDMFFCTVTCGNGSGWYAPGQSVYISANDSSYSGKGFDHWAGPDSTLVENDTGRATYIAMPARDISVTATFRTLFLCTIIGGSGSGSYDKGQKVQIHANDSTASKIVFYRWSGPDSGLVARDSFSGTNAYYNFTMPARNITIIALHLPACNLTFDQNGGDAIGFPKLGPLVAIGKSLPWYWFPQPPTRHGYFFAGWNVKADGSGAVFSKVSAVPSDMTVYAQWGSAISGISAGQRTSLFMTAGGTLFGCGKSFSGWSDGYETSGGYFTPCALLADVAAAAGVMSAFYVVKKDKTLWECPNNRSMTTVTPPAKIMDDVAAVSAMMTFTMMVKQDNTLWASGSNEYGQLGTGGPATAKSAPVQVTSGVAAASAGFWHAMILKQDNSLWACGRNNVGQLGLGDTATRRSPAQVLAGVKSVSAGGFHTLILKQDNTLWACGGNYDGQLGDGSTVNRYSPVRIMDSVASVAAGRDHSMIIKLDGTLWAAGSNQYGQLGDRTKSDRSIPVCIAGAGKVAAVAAGEYHTVILKNDGTAWTAGGNFEYQLGDGSTADRSKPVQVMPQP
jgi:uncharacterized repeat protein (TIGR02543 family)